MIEIYERYLAALKATPPAGRMMPYDWSRLPNSLSFTWMPYRLMFDEFSREIANSVNELTNHVHRLRAWSAVISTITDQDELMEAVSEFIEPLATVSLTLPYVIRSRCMFAIAHLCHQANRSLEDAEWEDNLPLDTEIKVKTANRYGNAWSAYDPCKGLIEQINSEGYRAATHDFRHAYNHRFSPRIVMGITNIVTRRLNTETKAASYTLGGVGPLKLDVVAELLADECQHAYAAFEAFQQLVREHEASIAKSNSVS
jgi:hypothetical protein